MFLVLWFEDLAAPIPIGSFKTADHQPLKAPYGRIWPHMGTLGVLGGSLGSLGDLGSPWRLLGGPWVGPWGLWGAPWEVLGGPGGKACLGCLPKCIYVTPF